MAARRILILGSGDVASATAHRLFMLGADVVIRDDEQPTHARRGMAFTDAFFTGAATLDGAAAVIAPDAPGVLEVWASADAIAATTTPVAAITRGIECEVVVDARMRKRSAPEDMRHLAPLAVGLGPGFSPGVNCGAAVETQWGVALGTVLHDGSTAALGGEPRPLDGAGRERFVYAPHGGTWRTPCAIGQAVMRGEIVGHLRDDPVMSPLRGRLRGLVRDGVKVAEGQKIVEVDPRNVPDLFGLGERPKAIARGVSRALGLPGGIERAFFGFEADYQAELDCMPVLVRWTLDRCELKLSLDQWRGLPRAVREAFVEVALNAPEAVVRMRAFLLRWTDKLGLGRVQTQAVVDSDVGAATVRGAVPDLVNSSLKEVLMAPFDAAMWDGLGELQRYAVIKLCRSRSGKNMRPALLEFGVQVRT